MSGSRAIVISNILYRKNYFFYYIQNIHGPGKLTMQKNRILIHNIIYKK